MVREEVWPSTDAETRPVVRGSLVVPEKAQLLHEASEQPALLERAGAGSAGRQASGWIPKQNAHMNVWEAAVLLKEDVLISESVEVWVHLLHFGEIWEKSSELLTVWKFSHVHSSSFCFVSLEPHCCPTEQFLQPSMSCGPKLKHIVPSEGKYLGFLSQVREKLKSWQKSRNNDWTVIRLHQFLCPDTRIKPNQINVLTVFRKVRVFACIFVYLTFSEGVKTSPDLPQQPEHWVQTTWQWCRSTARAPGRSPKFLESRRSAANPGKTKRTCGQKQRVFSSVTKDCSKINLYNGSKHIFYRLKHGCLLNALKTTMKHDLRNDLEQQLVTYFTLLLDQPGAFSETMLLQWTLKRETGSLLHNMYRQSVIYYQTEESLRSQGWFLTSLHPPQH